MKKFFAVLFFAALFFAADFSVSAQTAEEIKWPQFAKDLRRFDVISFGIFPFAYLVTNIGYDLYRSYQHNWDAAYFPWPVKDIASAFGVSGSGANTSWQADDYKAVVLGAAAVSLGLAVIDLSVILIRRAIESSRAKARGKPAIEIYRRPLSQTLETQEAPKIEDTPPQ